MYLKNFMFRYYPDLILNNNISNNLYHNLSKFFISLYFAKFLFSEVTCIKK